MAEYYTSVAEVQRVLKSLHIGTARESDLTADDVLKFIIDADNYINSMLEPVYILPLNKVTDQHDQLVYPYPIPYIATRICVADMIANYFTEKEDVVIANSNQVDAIAKNLLRNVIIGATTLPGQQKKARTRFCNPNIIQNAVPGTIQQDTTQGQA